MDWWMGAWGVKGLELQDGVFPLALEGGGKMNG